MLVRAGEMQRDARRTRPVPREDAAEVDVLLRDAWREGVAEVGERFVGWRERELQVMRRRGGRGSPCRRCAAPARRSEGRRQCCQWEGRSR